MGPREGAGVRTGSLCHLLFLQTQPRSLGISSRAGPGLCPSPGPRPWIARVSGGPSCTQIPSVPACQHDLSHRRCPQKNSNDGVGARGRRDGGLDLALWAPNPQATGHPWASGRPVSLPGPGVGARPLGGAHGDSRSLIFEPVRSRGACPHPRHSPDGRESCTAQGSGTLSPDPSLGSRGQR